MKAHEEGVSTVLGAILMFAILTVTLVSIQVKFVPVWDHQRERDTMLAVDTQMGAIKSDLDRLAANETSFALSDPITLSPPQGFAFFQGYRLPGTVTFNPAVAGTGMAIASNQLTIQQQAGTPLYDLAENWSQVAGAGQSFSSVADIVHLRIRLDNPSVNPGTLTLLVTDANGKCAGEILITTSVQAGSGFDVLTQVFGPTSPPGATCPGTPSGTPLTQTDTDWKKQVTPAFFYIDAFDPALQFAPVLAAVTYPATVALTQSGAVGEFTMVYDTVSGGITTRQGATGIVVPNYSILVPSGTLRVHQPNQRAPVQNFTVEYGAVMVDQPGEGAAMMIPPQFGVSTTTAQTVVTWTFPALVGTTSSVTGSSSASVVATPPVSTLQLQAFAPRLSFALNTTHGAQWRAFWDQALQLAGLTSSAGQYSIVTSANSATLTIYGPTTAPASLANDILLNLREAPVTVSLLPSGS
ncbi:MAG: hypothetical protein ACYDBQ_10415 [Thermoplasmatota archaeon]